jgi:hypothetical protein
VSRAATATAESAVAEMLRREWRMFERVSLTLRPDGDGYDAAIELNQTLVQAAVEQQGLGGTPATMAAAEARRSRAIAECLERVNAKLPPASQIRQAMLIEAISPSRKV